MINWCKQNTLLLLITSYFWSGQSSNVADSIVTKAECSNLNTAYQKVYSFETENHHINICQLGNKFYYYRQSKANANNILVPAEAVVRGSVFQAQADQTTYFVGIDSDRYYSSVMSNNNEIVLEPEIPSACAPDLTQVSNQPILTTDYSNASFGVNPSEVDLEQIPICHPQKPTVSPAIMLEFK